MTKHTIAIAMAALVTATANAGVSTKRPTTDDRLDSIERKLDAYIQLQDKIRQQDIDKDLCHKTCYKSYLPFQNLEKLDSRKILAEETLESCHGRCNELPHSPGGC